MASKRNKTPVYRHQDPIMQDRFAEWDVEARAWVREESARMLETGDVELTAGRVVVELDRRPDAPRGYVRYIEPALYDRRYQLVRTELDRLEREGYLQTGTTVNERGREGVRCYRRARRPAWRVEVEPANPAVHDLIEAYMSEHGDSFRGIDTILLVRDSEDHLQGVVEHGGEARGGRSSRPVGAPFNN